MGEPLLSVCWQDHTSELATIYKSLLEKNFLVDCTISAEGQNLKAHRLVLSASSPYFQKLFSEETGMHPFVILLDASFETLKAVIDFVYRGETQIPEGNLRAFLALAQALQIKGLNVLMQDCENNTSTENVPRGPSGKHQVTSEVQDINAILEESSENSSQKNSHNHGYGDSVSPNSCAPLQGYRASCNEVRTASGMTPLQEQWRSQECDDVPDAMEMAVKNEPVYGAARSEKLDNVKSVEPTSGNFTRNRGGGTSSVCAEEDVNMFSRYNETSHGNVEPSKLPSSHEQLMQLGDQASSVQDVAEGSEPLLPVVLVPKIEQFNDEESGEPMDYPDDPGNDLSETMEETGPPCDEQNLDNSRAEGVPPVDGPANQQRSGVRLCSRGAPDSKTALAHSKPEGQGGKPGGSKPRKAPTATGTAASPNPSPTQARPFTCDVCGAAFTMRSSLFIHSRSHRGDRPYVCDVCKASFAHRKEFLAHNRTHDGERPHICDKCGASFPTRRELVSHSRIHTKVRPFICDVCGASFTMRSHLVTHNLTHTGGRPHRCDVCGKAFALPHHLTRHKRLHTGDRPHRCEFCDKTFVENHDLKLHRRIHTGERPHLCQFCGKGFTQKQELNSHLRIHTGERPYRCEACGKGFVQSGARDRHALTHVGGTENRRDVCGQMVPDRERSHVEERQ